jgi:hypothetical protein
MVLDGKLKVRERVAGMAGLKGLYIDHAELAAACAATTFAAAWKFFGLGKPATRQGPPDSLYALGYRIRKAVAEAERRSR